ncbi:MAG: hypothetical protein Q9195_000558 [Heterodermia aff. obscurata]
MTPLPPPSPSITAQYDQLLSILTNTYASSQVLEIDILPSSFPPALLHANDPPSLGIPKTLLIPLFLIAHRRFFSYIHHHGQKAITAQEEDYKQALAATTVLLLWDPNHTTAANFRKRHIASPIKRTQELIFLESLLTSPLPKHTKSSTLWSYRLWLLSSRPTGDYGGWKKELAVVMKAGERHPRNYYAWNYARDLLRAICGGEEELGTRKVLMGESLREVHYWCLQHPGDISGWSFLLFLLRMGDFAREAGEGFEGEARRCVEVTGDFMRKFEWKGESARWFLSAVEQFQNG